MTQEQLNFIKRNSISLTTLVAVLGIFANIVRWQEKTDNRIKALEIHATDREVHLPFKDRVEIFVPRIELDGRLQNIENSLIEIKADLKKNFEK